MQYACIGTKEKRIKIEENAKGFATTVFGGKNLSNSLPRQKQNLFLSLLKAETEEKLKNKQCLPIGKTNLAHFGSLKNIKSN